MARVRNGNARKPNQNLPQEITLEDLDPLDTRVTQSEIGLIEHYFQELLKDLFTKGPTP